MDSLTSIISSRSEIRENLARGWQESGAGGLKSDDGGQGTRQTGRVPDLEYFISDWLCNPVNNRKNLSPESLHRIWCVP